MKSPIPAPRANQTAKIIPIRPDVKPSRKKRRNEVAINVPRAEYALFSKMLYIVANSQLRTEHVRYYVESYARKVEESISYLNHRLEEAGHGQASKD